jgi:serine/threonine-protein kinase
MQLADGTGPVERLTTGSVPQTIGDISSDGHWLVFTELAATGSDILGLSLETHQTAPLLHTPFEARNPRISPDRRWLAYEANDSGRMEIHVRPFPSANSGHWQVSTDGGVKPVWSRDSRELFYISPSGELMRVGVTAAATWSNGSPVKVLDAKYQTSAANTLAVPYDVSLDGTRFLMIREPAKDVGSAAAPASLVVVQHFDQELKRVLGR